MTEEILEELLKDIRDIIGNTDMVNFREQLNAIDLILKYASYTEDAPTSMGTKSKVKLDEDNIVGGFRIGI